MSDEETGTDITSEQFRDWSRSKVTAYVLKELGAIREARKDELVQGATMGPNPRVTTDFAVGYIQGLSLFLDMKFSEDDKKTVSEYGH